MLGGSEGLVVPGGGRLTTVDVVDTCVCAEVWDVVRLSWRVMNGEE
jgi:hypothetical protein